MPHPARFVHWWPVFAGVAAILLSVLSAAWIISALDWIPGAGDGGGAAAAGTFRPEIAIATGSRAVPASGACGRCGVIESVRPMKRTLNPPGVASVSEGRAGEVIAVLHVIMNAIVGNSLSAASRPAQSYEVVVRFYDGSTRTLAQAGAPSWSPGDRVKVINGRIKPGT